MKLKNKISGEIKEFALFDGNELQGGVTLESLTKEWEDYEEPKKYWFIDAFGNIVQNEITKHYGDEYTDMTDAYESQKQIGNHFETKEEAELAVRKLKAWKRLRDKGFRFIRYKRIGFGGSPFHIDITASIDGASDTIDKYEEDLQTVFGGEE